MQRKSMDPIKRRPADPPTRRPVAPFRPIAPWIPLVILAVPSLYVLLTLPPLWRDSDGFNEIASTFAPKGIIHWLPGYCLGGRLIVFGGSLIGSLLSGHGVPYLSISITPLNNAGIYSLIVVQHVFLVLSLFYAARTLTENLRLQILYALLFALTPWLYLYANCIGSEAFSNPFIYLLAAYGWNCLRTGELTRRKVLIYFGLLLAASLTRQVNALLAAGLPIALLPFAGKEILNLRRTDHQENRFFYSRRLLIFVLVGFSAIGSSVLVQQTLCWVCRVPFRSTFGETFLWRLSFLGKLPVQERTALLAGIASKIGDPVVTEALGALDQSLDHGEKWTDMFLFYKIDEILLRSGSKEMQNRTWQIDRKLNRIATCVLLSDNPYFLNAVWVDFKRWPFFTQTDLAYPPFELTDWLQTQLPYPRYGRLRDLASFQHQQGYFSAAWKQIPYAHFLEMIPMLWMGCLAVVLVGFTLFVASRPPVIQLGPSYVVALVVVGVLISLANCFSTFFGARFYLPVYSLLQMSMLLAASLAIKTLLKGPGMERLESFDNSR
jgi:hypothetical protein